MSPTAQTTERRAASTTPAQTMLEAMLALASGNQELPPLNQDQIDTCIAEYEFAERNLAAAKAVHETCKLGLIAVVEAHGNVPAGADKSKRVSGRRNEATITRGTTIEINEDGVAELERYLDDKQLPTLFHQLFATCTKHMLLKGAAELLPTVQIRKPEHDRISTLFGQCITAKPKAPALKVTLITPEKPVRTSRADKAGA